jgi:hypothetical protein
VPIQARISNTLAQRAWLRRLLRWSALIVAAWLVLACASWLALPYFVKKIAIEQVQTQLGRKADIGAVGFNPFILKLTVSDFTLYETDRRTPAVTVKTLILNASASSLLRRALVLDEGLMFDPKVHLIRTGAEGIGRYNFSDVIERILAKPKSEGSLPFLLSNLQLQGGDILFDDRVTGKRIEITALNLGAPLLSNLPASIDTFVQPYASAAINGAHLALKGRSKPFADSRETSLALDVEQLDLASYMPFSPVELPLKLRSGKLSTKLDLRFSRIKAQPEVLLSGDIRLDDLSLADKNDAPLLTSRSVQAKIKQINLLGGASAIDALSLDTPEIWAALDRHNVLNWARLGATPAAKPAAAAGTASTAPAAPPGNAAKADTAPSAAPVLLLTQLTVHDGKLNWADDYNAAPRQNVQLNHIDVDVQQLSTAADAKPATVKLSAEQAGGGRLQIRGQVAPLKAEADIEATLDGLPLAHYQPYANKVLAAGVSGQLSLRAKIGLAAGRLKLSGLNADVSAFRLAARTQAGGAIAAKSIVLSDAAVDTGTRRFQAAALRIKGLNGAVTRDAKGVLNLQQFMLPTSAPATTPARTRAAAAARPARHATAPAADWQADIGEFAIADSNIAYQDNTVVPALNLQADALKLTLNNVSSRFDRPLGIALEAKLNKSGTLTVNGTGAAQFKSIDLNINANRISVAPLQPYFNDYVNVTLRRGFVSAKGKLSIVPPVNRQALAINYAGAAQLSGFSVQDKDTNVDFLRWRTLDLSGLDARIGKGAPLIGIAKVTLDTFYARAILSPAGKLNLKDILVSQDAPPAAANAKTVAKTTVTTTPVTPAAAAPGAAVIRIGQTVLSGGNVNFTDNFVKPNYTANMTGMNGTIGSIASDKPQPAAIDLKGKIDDDAELLISGSLNPLFKPMFLDIKASTKGVELTRMTPYAAKYAGYPIIKGKLSMDVSYKIENQQLVAQNDLRIDQLTFGDRVDSPDATKLPVMLAVALLKDRNGQINLNLPISGSLSDPQFSIGGIIGRIITNLIVKVVTSPFALLNSVFGGGNDGGELGYVEFAPGADALTEAATKKLETLTKALADRPALKLDIIGRTDPIADTNGLRREALDDKVKQMKRRDMQIRGPVTLNDADRAKYLESVYKNEKFDKPKNVIGFAKSLPPDEMQRLILENTPVGPEQLRDLALRRAESVRKYLEENGKISLERVYLVAPKLNADGITDKGAATRVDFSLK